MKNSISILYLLLVALLLVAQVPAAQAAPTVAPIVGEIERLTVNDANDVYSGGVVVVGGVEVILPKNLLIDLPANRLTLQQIFAQAPAGCVANGESGLAKTDKCIASGTGGFATLSAVNSTNGNVIAGDVLIDKGLETLTGKVSYIDYAQGFFRVNGDASNPNTGVMVRLNDPTAKHTIQSGAGCAGGPNCSPDPRFTLDPENYTNVFATGYPLCIPSTTTRNFPGLPAVNGVALLPAQSTQADANGAGDLLCPSTNRTPAALLEPPVADSRRFAPIAVGDTITCEGSFETINGVRFLSAHTTQVGKALGTRNDPNQPDYLFLAEVFIEAPAFQNQRQRAMWIGYTTLAPTDVDFWSIHRDPVANGIHEFPLASVRGCDNADALGTCSSQGLVDAGANIFRIRYDVDFLMARLGFPSGTKDGKLSPCDHLSATNAQTPNRFAPLNICGSGINLANQFGILSPVPHEIQARTGHLLDNPALEGKTIDVSGNTATNGQYLFPLGLNLGGIEVAEMNEIDLNAMATPIVFEGIPWNLDRRLGPGGCQNGGGCESDPLGTYALDPFPFSGLDPRTQADPATGGLPTASYSDPAFTASSLGSAQDRIFSYVAALNGGGFNFNGNSTLLPYVLGSFPADPPLVAINQTPVLNIFPPIAVDDSATTAPGSAVQIQVLANDVPILGEIAVASVQVVTPPATGTTQVANGVITYTPTTAGTVTFTYTVANNFGSVSLPATVTVEVNLHTITAAAGPNGSITPAGASQVPLGAEKTYIVTPNAGYKVFALVVDGASAPVGTSYTFANVSASHYINAYFEPQTFTLSASATTNGSITPAGAVTAAYGSARNYSIVPDAGYRIENLVVDGVTIPAASSYTFTSITGDHGIGASFVANNYTLTAAAGLNGTISPAGASTVTGGSTQSYTITPAVGYQVALLVVDGVTLPGATSYSFSNVSANHYINAYFEPAGGFTINAAAGLNGTISPAGAAVVAAGDSQSFTITPNLGYAVSALVVDGATLAGATSYTFTNVSANHYINAYFAPASSSFTITSAAGPNGSITPAGATSVASGADQSYTITPNDGFEVSALVVDDVTLAGATSYTFTGVSAPHYINAYFSAVAPPAP